MFLGFDCPYWGELGWVIHGEGRFLQADELDILKKNLSPQDFR